MVDEYYFEDQNGIRSVDKHIFMEEYPSIKLGQEVLRSTTIPGRGNVWKRTGTYEDTEISMLLDVNTSWTKPGRMDAYTAARRFLQDCRTITFCDAPAYFYKVKKVELGKVAQYTDNAGDFDVLIICSPGVYLKDGIKEYAPAAVQENPYSECRPIYKLTGEGMCTLKVNGKAMTANVGQNLTIDTDRMIAYRTDGTMQNTAVSGDYDGLYLIPGHNAISVTDGFGLKVIPNWRCL